MNYYQSLNTNSKIFFLTYQICKLEKISEIYYNRSSEIMNGISDSQEDGEHPDDYEMLDREHDDLHETISRLNKMINQKQLKLKLMKKYYE